jgi:hypothetical protein
MTGTLPGGGASHSGIIRRRFSDAGLHGCLRRNSPNSSTTRYDALTVLNVASSVRPREQHRETVTLPMRFFPDTAEIDRRSQLPAEGFHCIGAAGSSSRKRLSAAFAVRLF